LSYRETRRHGCYGAQIRRARRVHARRSDMARHIDERLKAPTARSFAQWNAQPNRFDLPNVDAPKKQEPEKSCFNRRIERTWLRVRRARSFPFNFHALRNHD